LGAIHSEKRGKKRDQKKVAPLRKRKGRKEKTRIGKERKGATVVQGGGRQWGGKTIWALQMADHQNTDH